MNAKLRLNKMPSRYIREDYLTSEHVDALDVHSERFFFRLFLVVDDFGRTDANLKILRSKCYPLKDDIRTTDISRFLDTVEKAGLIHLYTVAGKRYLEILRFNQSRSNCRSAKSKFPDPPELFPKSATACNTLQQVATTCRSTSTSSNNLKAFAADNEYDNDNEYENENDNRAREGYPTSVADVINISRSPHCAVIMTQEQAEAYFTSRMASDWIDAQNRKIQPNRVAYDIKKWVMRDNSSSSDKRTRNTRATFAGDENTGREERNGF